MLQINQKTLQLQLNFKYANGRTPTNAFRNIYVYGNILPRDDAQGSGTSDLGGPSKRFRDLYLKGTTINLGDTQLRDDNGTFVMPENTAIGNVNNVIPRI